MYGISDDMRRKLDRCEKTKDVLANLLQVWPSMVSLMPVEQAGRLVERPSGPPVRIAKSLTS
jgi:hypothetical protein